ncbi:hypothetical protein MTsPCn9_17540 [Croceitalea sp. MTPC9]|uniref:DUF4097 family beta strand repeat-containing protein n=1 Tax=unclassified Croceitalea TaxID=2632280 RepID=UPI002B3D6114|nr:hypothetical protein MTsPCn6_10390 [Croceitalea sp. MTPC6]GMN16818.1 hypothetical protein MTsPCn9_17540 [Croceitalea sp. MTPC9]
MKASYLLIFIFLFPQFLVGQKVVEKAILNPDQQYIQLDTKNCYLVELSTSKNKELRIEAYIEGEYTKDLVVRLEEDGSNVLVSVDFLPNFVAPNDKLSAHKVISIALKLAIPEFCDVTVFGTNSKVVAEGRYRNLKISLANGDCLLKDVSENVEVKTQKGNINVMANKGAIEAKSTYGSVKMFKLAEGDSTYKLVSVEGNIYVNKTE